MRFTNFIGIITLLYGLYYLIILLLDFFKNGETAVYNGSGNNIHFTNFDIPQQPQNVIAARENNRQALIADDFENDFRNEKLAKAAQQNNSTVMTDLGLEIISGGIDISAENLTMLLS